MWGALQGHDLISGRRLPTINSTHSWRPISKLPHLPVTYNEYDEKEQLWTKKTSIRLGDFLKLQLSRANANREEPQFHAPVQFETPVGTEAYLAKWLRGSGLLERADLDPGGCDGMDASYFVINRGLLFDADGLSQAKFEQYIGIKLNDFVSRNDMGKAWQFRLGQPFTKRINIPPYPLAYRTQSLRRIRSHSPCPRLVGHILGDLPAGRADRHQEDRICGRSHDRPPQEQQEIVR